MVSAGRRKFILDFIFTSLGRLILAVRPLIFIPLVARGLGQESYGIWCQVALTATFLGQIITFRLPSLLTRFVSGTKDDNILSSRMLAAGIFPLGIYLLLGVAVLPWQGSVAKIVFGDSKYATYVIPMLFYCATTSAVRVMVTYFLVVGRQRIRAVITTIWGLLEISVAAVAAGWYDIWTVVMALSVWQTIFVVVLTLYVIRKHGLTLPKLPLKRDFWVFGVWLVLEYVVYFWASSGTSYILVWLMGIEAVAVYVVAYTVSKPIHLICNANARALLPSISAHWNAGRSDLARPLVSIAYKMLFLLAMPIIGGLYVYGNTLIGLLATKSFLLPSWMLCLLALAPLANSFFDVAQYAMWMVKKVHILLPVELIGVAANVLLSLLLIKPLGILGAIIGVVSSMLIVAAIGLRMSMKVFKVGIDIKHTLRCVLCATLMALGLLAYQRLVPLGRIASLVSGVFIGIVLYGLLALLFKAVPARYVKQAVDAVKRKLGFTTPAVAVETEFQTGPTEQLSDPPAGGEEID